MHSCVVVYCVCILYYIRVCVCVYCVLNVCTVLNLFPSLFSQGEAEFLGENLPPGPPPQVYWALIARSCKRDWVSKRLNLLLILTLAAHLCTRAQSAADCKYCNMLLFIIALLPGIMIIIMLWKSFVKAWLYYACQYSCLHVYRDEGRVKYTNRQCTNIQYTYTLYLMYNCSLTLYNNYAFYTHYILCECTLGLSVYSTSIKNNWRVK